MKGLACRLAPFLLAVALASGGGAAPRRDVSTLMEGKAALRRALAHLQSTQKEDGSWQGQPAITALVVTAMLGSGEEGFDAAGPAVSRGLAYIRSFAQPNGGIYDRGYASYSTSICAMALVEAGLPQDKALLARARAFLLGAQADESEDLTPQDVSYGGWGYESEPGKEPAHRADMSNTHFAIEALKRLQEVAEEDVPEAGAGQQAGTRTELAYGRALEFLARCQNLKAVNDQPWAGNDGGFVYRPGESKAGETAEGGLRSYGGMTYAGLKSMIYARLSKDDRRVAAAWDWIRRHWSVAENPGLGDQGLYYYYLTMARALAAYGEDVVVDAAGTAHDWRAELFGQLLKVQQADGSWVGANGRWMEQMPDLVTAYCVLAIEQAMAAW
jgi:squalene-hopene/tetraprenyl-beta-curcumene cyclase